MATDSFNLGIPLPADSTKISEFPAVTRRGLERVAEVLAGGMTEAAGQLVRELTGAAVESAVLDEIAEAGIMRGRTTVPLAVEDAVWRQTTETGGYLPLGYTAGGRLDSFARQIWREDVNNTTQVSAHPHYARVITTEESEILLAVRWDGTVEIPGLAGTGSGTGPGAPAPATYYNDSPYTPDSDILPAAADPLNWSMFGSSSAGGVAAEMQKAAADVGAKFYNGGVGWESSFHIAARLGSVPALLTFPGGKIQTAGAGPVTVSNITYLQQMATFAGYVTAADGTRIKGTLGPNTATLGFTFTRTGSGAAAAIPDNAPFIPDAGTAHRADTMFLWLGKNNYWQPDRVIRETNASFDYLAPLAKRCMVLGHFVNTNTAAGSTVRTQIQQINAAYKARYGAAYCDVPAYLTGSQVWKDTGITPTAADLEQQALGNKPPSLSVDDGHLNAAANKAVVHHFIIKQAAALRWLTPSA